MRRRESWRESFKGKDLGQGGDREPRWRLNVGAALSLE